jgi:hypothetical protein
MQPQPETKKALIVVRTYPVPEEDGVESSCTAAITENGEWLRLFPVPYRLMPPDKRFQKYQWVEVSVTKSRNPRPESYRPRIDSIKIVSDPLSTDNCWQARRNILFPLKAASLCEFDRRREQNGRPTLGFFKPKTIERLQMVAAIPPDWTPAQLAILRQEHLFEKKPSRELEKIPFHFRYEFLCDDSTCTTKHALMCTDWEMGESYRKWKQQYGDKWEEKFRQRYETEMIGEKDTHFFVGTLKAYPWQWIIVGLLYPPIRAQAEMF